MDIPTRTKHLRNRLKPSGVLWREIELTLRGEGGVYGSTPYVAPGTYDSGSGYYFYPPQAAMPAMTVSGLVCNYVSLADASVHSECFAMTLLGSLGDRNAPIVNSSTANPRGFRVDFGHDLAFLAYRYPPNAEYWYSP